MVWGLGVVSLDNSHVNASHGLGFDIFIDLSVIAVLRLKLFRLFLETAVQYDYSIKSMIKNSALRFCFFCTDIGLCQEARVYPKVR